MECIETEEMHQILNDADTKYPESPENFQKFIYELFDKNGILNDLRAYLRGHIVNVLKTADTGNTMSCQKNFTQRLEHMYQAINILIAEYLLRLEFNYTLSVFVSEIPLANMIFGFSKALINTDSFDLYFEDNDVWSILSCLGIECDSEHACKISEMYRSKEIPLLMCIIKCTTLCQRESFFINNEENVISDKSTDTFDRNCKTSDKRGKCRHYSFCKTCQYRVIRIKEKYERRKTRLNETPKSMNSLDIGNLMKNLSTVEQAIINEMFDHLKCVYESEVDMVKAEKENTIRKSIASHTVQLQKKREELEESFKDRESALCKSIDEKKKFVWNLAKSLRQQHGVMTKAMDDVKSETERLNAKEQNLKSQMKEAEDLLRKRGEDMRRQISEELLALEEHLQAMKRERDSINVERERLQRLKDGADKGFANDLHALKRFVENNAKCLAEKGTATDNILNNDHVIVNDLKRKNVSMSVEAIHNDQVASRSSSSDRDQTDREDDFCDRTELQRLRIENHRLSVLAKQQSDHIASLASDRSRLQSELTNARPRTSPNLDQPFAGSNIRALVSSVGSGEQVHLFPQRRVFIPTDTLPFIGVLKDRHTDNRRHLLSQLRCLRRRVTPQLATSSKLVTRDLANIRDEEPTRSSNKDCVCNVCSEQTKKQSEFNEKRTREKSPKSVLREAKEKLRNNHSAKEPLPVREKSPNTTLREAKMRLRKLEIEAEAVERSYQDFRRRQRDEEHFSREDIQKSNSLKESTTPDINTKHLDKYLKDYQSFEISFKNKNTISEVVKPIPAGFSRVDSNNYLETPLAEFRQLYHTRITSGQIKARSVLESNGKVDEDFTELNIPQDNINKRNNFTPDVTQCHALENLPEVTKDCEKQENVLRVDIEKKCDIEVDVATSDMNVSEPEMDGEISAQMTILVSPKVKGDGSFEAAEVTGDGLNEFHNGKYESSESKRDSDIGAEYPDDFSDNYSRSGSDHSPISVAKDSDEYRSFWENP